MRLPLLLILFVGLLFLFNSCKKDKHEQPTAPPEIPLYDCALQFQGMRDDEGKDVQLSYPIKLIVTDSVNDTVHIDYFTVKQKSLKFLLPSGVYVLNVVDTTGTFAPYTIQHTIKPKTGGSPIGYFIYLSMFPRHKISLVSINDTIINNEKGILLHVVTPTTKDTVYYFGNFFKSPLSYPISYEYYNSLFGYYYTVNGTGTWFYRLSSPSHTYIKKGEVYYFSVVEIARDWLHNSRNEASSYPISYNATGKVIQNFQFINY